MSKLIPQETETFSSLPLRDKITLIPTGFYARFGKRYLDISLCIIGLPIVVLILATVWIIGQFLGGKVLFTQKRVGKDGKIFNCFKVRTMEINADQILAELCTTNPKIASEWNKYQKLKNDPRISRWGAFLRKTSIDELPQVFNVLRGDMSVVGPRPFMVSQEDLYRKNGGDHYFSLRPGITGKWQVYDRGKTSFVSRVDYDQMYASEMSLALDLQTILKTFKIMLKLSGH